MLGKGQSECWQVPRNVCKECCLCAFLWLPKKCGGRETHIYSLVVLEVRSLKSLSWAEVNRLAEPVPSFRRLRGDSGSQPFPGLEAPCICWLVAAPLIAPDSRFYQHISFILLRLFCLPLVRTLIFGLTWVIAADLPSSRSLT